MQSMITRKDSVPWKDTGKKETEESLEIGLESQKLVSGFVNKVSYCHSYLRRREKNVRQLEIDIKNVLIFRKYKKAVYKDK